MTLREANDILQNSKEHWSHEIDDAKKYCIEAVKYLVNAADYRFLDEAQIAIKYLDERIAAVKNEERIDIPVLDTSPENCKPVEICSNCIWFDPIGHCQQELGLKSYVSPLNDASSCKCYSPYPKEDK